MLGPWTFVAFDEYVSVACPHYKQFWGSWALVALENYPFYLTVGLIAVSLYRNEKYLQLVSMFLTMDWLVNYVVKDLIVQQESPTKGCGGTYGMPSYSAEQLSLFSTLMLGFAEVWGTEHVGMKPVLLSLGVILPCFSIVYVGFSSPIQVIIGVQCGVLEGVLYLWLTREYIWPRFETVSNWRIVKLMGYQDTLCGPFQPIEGYHSVASDEPTNRRTDKRREHHSERRHDHHQEDYI